LLLQDAPAKTILQAVEVRSRNQISAKTKSYKNRFCFDDRSDFLQLRPASEPSNQRTQKLSNIGNALPNFSKSLFLSVDHFFCSGMNFISPVGSITPLGRLCCGGHCARVNRQA